MTLVATTMGYLSIGSIRSTPSICNCTLLCIVSGPHKKIPVGIFTTPPASPFVLPAAVAALMAFWIADVFVATPSPTAL